MKQLLWLVPLLPLLGAVWNGVVAPLVSRRTSERAVAFVACGASGLAALLSLGVLADYLAGASPRPFALPLWEWIGAGMLRTDGGPVDLTVGFGLLLDPLSAVMLFVVTFVGFWIHLYSVGYMAGEPGFRRYFTYLNLFLVAMLVLVLGDGYAPMFVGWEGVGLCSYLLIGFYFDRESAADAGRKAFVVNRIGDLGFLVALFALAVRYGTLRFDDLLPKIAADAVGATAPFALGLSFAAFVALFLFVGAAGKSAQIPLYVWLPDAMAGPTPVSALIHAATMVTAGVYMVVRSNVLYQLAPSISTLVATVGALTALFAASIAVAQTDLKKILAYSTISQLGYMFLAAGVGAYSAAVFHLATHAFFKALLFLGAGAVIHALSGEQDVRKMGGLWKKLPITAPTFLLGVLAIAGVPPLAGFWSKDQILAGVAESGRWGLFAIALLTAGLTAFYMMRAFALAFLGAFRGSHEQEHHLHEAPRSMSLALVVLAAGAVLAGFVGVPAVLGGSNGIGRFLAPIRATIGGEVVGEHGGGHDSAEHALSHATELGLMALALAAAGLGLVAAYRLYRGGPERGARLATRFPRLHSVLVNKWFVDEIYGATVVRGTWGLSRLLARFDAGAIDGGLVEGASRATVASSGFSGLFDRHVVDGLVNLTGWLLDRGSRGLRRLQSGLVSTYALTLVVGALLLVCLYAFAR